MVPNAKVSPDFRSILVNWWYGRSMRTFTIARFCLRNLHMNIKWLFNPAPCLQSYLAVYKYNNNQNKEFIPSLQMIEDIYNYLLLTESIATAGQPTERQIAAIAESGYKMVINLGLADAEYALDNEEAVVRDHGMQYIHLPVIWERPTVRDLNRFIEVMETNKRKNVFVHCAANMRVSVFMALYRILRLGWSEEKAFEQVKRIWVPNDVWQTFIDEILEQQSSVS